MKVFLNSLGVHSKIIFSIAKSGDNMILAHAFLKLENNAHYLKKKDYYEVMTIG
jgi:hypothetical protein